MTSILYKTFFLSSEGRKSGSNGWSTLQNGTWVGDTERFGKKSTGASRHEGNTVRSRALHVLLPKDQEDKEKEIILIYI